MHDGPDDPTTPPPPPTPLPQNNPPPLHPIMKMMMGDEGAAAVDEHLAEGDRNPPYRINNCKFQHSMINFLSDLHDSKAYTDVMLHAEGKLLSAHKIVLAAGSSYFNSLFKSVTTPHLSATPHQIIVALPNVRHKDLDLVIKFIYCGYVDIVNSDLDGFVGLAKELGVVGMVNEDDEQTAPQPADDKADLLRLESPGNENDLLTDDHELLGQVDSAIVQKPDEQLHTDLEPDDLASAHSNVIMIEDKFIPSSSSSSTVLLQQSSQYQQIVQISSAFDDDGRGGDDEYYEFEDEEDEDEERAEDDDDAVAEVSRCWAGNNSSHQVADDERAGGGSGGGGGGGGKPFVCTKCGKTYNSNKSLWRHKKFTCDEKIEFRCSVCDKVFSRSDNLRRHVVVAHHHH